MYIQGQFEMKRMQCLVSACLHLIRFNTSLIKSQSAIIAKDCRRPSHSTPGLAQSQREQNCLQAAYVSKQSPVRIHCEGLKMLLFKNTYFILLFPTISLNKDEQSRDGISFCQFGDHTHKHNPDAVWHSRGEAKPGRV